MALVRPFEYVIQSRSTATLLHSISKIHEQSLINLYQLIFLSFLKERAAQWFSEKWSIPEDAYLESIEESFNSIVPSWYVCIDGEEIIAGKLLDFVCSDMASKGIRTLYLLTNVIGLRVA